MRRRGRRTSALLAAALVLGLPGQGAAGSGDVDLSPASWPAGDLETYGQLNQAPRRQALAHGESGMVVGTTGALAVRAGLEALRQGGTAADAALVTALTQVTLAGGSWVSYAGILTLVYYEAAPRKVRYLNGEFNTVLAEDDPLSIPAAEPSGRTAMVPGFMAAVEVAHRRFGELPFEQLFVPARHFASEGFVLDATLAGTIAFRADLLRRHPEARAIFFKGDGTPYRAGDLFRQPQLAETLAAVGRQGASYMYTGSWAERLIAALAAEGGRMSMADLAAYRVLSSKPKKGRFRGYLIRGPGHPGAGGKLLARTFRALHPLDLRGLGHHAESAETLYQLLRVTRDAYRSVPPLNHSDGVIAVDRWGNVATLLHSINTTAWGGTGIFVDGVSIPDAAAHQQHRILAAGPGNRIWTGVNPAIVVRNRRPVLASSAIGNGLFEATVQGLVNALEFGMDPKQALEAPTFRSPRRSEQPVDTWPVRVTRGDFPAELLDEVRARGIPIVELPRVNFEGMGYWIAVAIDPDTGELTGATTSAFNGLAEGY